tara:strand:+ start:61 stop:282 length:222 start_codon:yes stop_codon:yes gene_type:complete
LEVKKMSKKNKIKNKLLEIINEDGTEWKVIVEEIKKIAIIKNWLLVRGIIQELKNENIIDRTDNVYQEIYIKL